MGLFDWIHGLFRLPLNSDTAHESSEYDLDARILQRNAIHAAGLVNGRHYTDYIEEIKLLKREKRHKEAIALLKKLIHATESASRVGEVGVAPAYYEELAIIYRKERDYEAEVDTLERFAAQRHAPGVMPAQLLERLEKARQLRDRKQT